MVEIRGSDVIYGGGCISLVEEVIGHPECAVIFAIRVVKSLFGLGGPLLRTIGPWTFPLHGSPRISQLDEFISFVRCHVKDGVGVADDNTLASDRL